MSKKTRLGDNPLETRKEQIAEGAGLGSGKSKRQNIKKPSSQEDEIKKEVARGGAKNYYINKGGDLIQKVTIHLPYDAVTRLKKQAVDQRVTLSELFREKLK